MTDYEGFHVEIDAARKVATITLDVPGKMNRVAITARAQLAQVFEELGRDDTVRCIVIRGSGTRAFAPGNCSAMRPARMAARMSARNACARITEIITTTNAKASQAQSSSKWNCEINCSDLIARCRR